ncbi:DUF1173 family protein (plasmid) [Thalassospira sp. SM2505]
MNVPDKIYLSDGRTITFKELNADPDHRDRLFLSLRRIAKPDSPQVFCGCMPRRLAPPLSIVCRDGQSPFLRRYRTQVHPHHEDCRHYLSEHTGRTDMLDRIEEIGDIFKIRLNTSLQRNTPSTGSALEDVPKPKKKSKSKPPLSCYSLFDFLWEQTHLNRWYPKMQGSRANTTLRFVQNEASHIQAGRINLGEVFQVVIDDLPGKHFHAAKRRLHDIARKAADNRGTMMILAELHRIPEFDDARPADARISFPIRGSDSYRIIPTGPADLVRALCKSVSAIEGRQLALLQGEPHFLKDGRFYFNVLDGSIRSVSSEFIPVDSGLELMTVKALVDQQRAFEKPLRFDPENMSLPDLVLLDTQPHRWIMEVFGRTDDDYLDRQREKSRKYDAAYGANGWWAWRANQGESMPTFPPEATNRFKV